MSFDRYADDPEYIEMEWWLDPALKGDMEFKPQYCEHESGTCFDAANWTNVRSYKLGSDDPHGLRPYTTYTVTVKVRLAGSSKEFPPAIYSNVTTLEASKSKIKYKAYKVY
jgi:hypothetical protein